MEACRIDCAGQTVKTVGSDYNGSYLDKKVHPFIQGLIIDV